MKDYRIIVPSRKRSANMPGLLALLPTAIICVDERELPEYSLFVPKGQLLTHPPLPNMPHIHNWLIECGELADVPTLVRMDDDLQRVSVVLEGRSRPIRDPREILGVIENSACNCEDLGLGVFCWSRQPNTTMVKDLETNPIRDVHPVFSAFGMMNAARKRQLDPTLHGRADVDFTLRTLLEDRVVYCDMRFYFDFGPIGYGSGGSAGLIQTDDYEEVTQRLVRRWGKHFDMHSRTPQVRGGGKRQQVKGTIQVRRRNHRAQQ